MTIILHSHLVLPDQSSNPFIRNLNILLTWKRSGRFINKCIYKWYVHYHLLWKLILANDVMGKCVSFLNKLTVTLPQQELSNPAASLPTVYHSSVFTSLTVSSQGIGKRPACQVPIHSAFSSWQESRERACQMPTMFIEETAPWNGGVSFWESVFSERWENMQRIQQCSQSCSWGQKMISGVTTYVWIVRSDLTAYLAL